MSFDPDAYLTEDHTQAFDPDQHLLTPDQSAEPEKKGYFKSYFDKLGSSLSDLGKTVTNAPGKSALQSIEGVPAALVAPIAHGIGGAAAFAENAISKIPGAQYLGFDPNSTFAKTNAGYQEAIGKEVDPRSDIGKSLSGVLGSAFSPVGDVLSVPGKVVQGAANLIGVSPENAKSAGEQTNAITNAALIGYGSRKSDIQESQKTQVDDKQAALKRANDLGLVVPPATANPSAINNLSEGFAGKLSTAQAASIKNQKVINNVVREEFGLPEDMPITSDTLNAVRKSVSPAYEAVQQVPNIEFGKSYNEALAKLTQTADKITSALPNYKSTGSVEIKNLIESLKPENGVMDGETAVELSKSLRSEAAAYDMTASRTGDPSARALGRAYRGASEAVENAVEDHLTKIGQPELAANWDNARRTIAKTYSVEKALDGAGNVDAGKLGKQLIKGKPLSGNLAAVADFANHFPKAAKATNESMPGMSPLDVYGSVGAATVSGNPLPLLLGPGRMAMRSTLLSPVGQYFAKKGESSINLSPIAKPASLAAILATKKKDDQR